MSFSDSFLFVEMILDHLCLLFIVSRYILLFSLIFLISFFLSRHNMFVAENISLSIKFLRNLTNPIRACN